MEAVKCLRRMRLIEVASEAAIYHAASYVPAAFVVAAACVDLVQESYADV